MESPERFRETLTTGVSDHADLEIAEHRKDPVIEEPVVKRAKSEAIGNLGRSSGSMPLDVGGIERYRYILDANGEFAHRAP